MTKSTVIALLVAMGLALVLMLVLRPLMRRGFGPRAQYLSWLLVPAFTLATLLPAPPSPLPVVSPQATQMVLDAQQVAANWIWHAQPGALDRAHAGGGFNLPWPVAVWWAGMVLLAGAVAWQHARWRRQLRWDAAAGRWTLPAKASPSVVGLLRPRLALPCDFEQRFNEAERAAVLAHEDVHAQRHDNLWNLLATAFWTLNWFNPLAWWALKAFQRDQELACDAAALARQGPSARDAYRDALLKAFEISPSSVLARGWRSSHPLIERLEWVQAGFVEKSWLSAIAVTTVVLVFSALAYSMHGGSIWQMFGPETQNAAWPGYARARIETQSQINGGQWASATDVVNVGKTRQAEQVLSWTETLNGRKVYSVSLKVTGEEGQAPSAWVQFAEAFDVRGGGAGVPEVQYATIPPDRWHETELRTRAGDLVRLRVRFQPVADAPAAP